ncbi:MAG: septum formation initiator family protein [Thiolinea sp.]
MKIKIKVVPLLYAILGGLALLLFMRLWAGAGSFPEIWELKEQIAEQTRFNQEQAERNERLEADVAELSKDDAAIEDHARSELGMIKRNETYYQVILREDEQAPPLLVDPDEKTGAHVE